MHELALCQAIADTVVERAAGRPVHRVHVRIGHLRQVVPTSLEFCWQMLTDATDLEGCELAIEGVPAVIVCRECGRRTQLDLPVFVCSGCGCTDVSLVSGEEFLLAALDCFEEL